MRGRRFVGLNDGPTFKPNEAVSFMVVTQTQEEIDRYWNAIVGNGGAESACGWCKDRLRFFMSDHTAPVARPDEQRRPRSSQACLRGDDARGQARRYCDRSRGEETLNFFEAVHLVLTLQRPQDAQPFATSQSCASRSLEKPTVPDSLGSRCKRWLSLVVWSLVVASHAIGHIQPVLTSSAFLVSSHSALLTGGRPDAHLNPAHRRSIPC